MDIDTLIVHYNIIQGIDRAFRKKSKQRVV
jgi:hypothetical protein